MRDGPDEANGGPPGTPDADGPFPADATEEYTPGQAEELERALQRAHRHGEELDWEGMAEHLRGTLEDFPGDPFVLCWLGVAERELGLEGIAYERFKQCLAAGPEDPHVLATAGTAVAAFDDPDAEPALRTAAMIAPRLPLARWMYGAYLSREGLPERALEELEAARELDPDDPVIHYELGVAQALAGDRVAAVDSIYRATELNPDDGWNRVILGLLLLEDDRLEEATAELAAGARERPEDVEAQLLASLSAGAYGLIDLAWEMLERARQLAEGVDQVLAQTVEERITSEGDAPLRFLRTQLAPSALRDRLMTRP